MARLRDEEPLVAADSIDVVVSNCVLNLVDPGKKRNLFGEILRVLKPGGRAVISDIVSGCPVSKEMMENPELWSGCLSGALVDSEFVSAFETAGFEWTRVLNYEREPWQIVEGICFHSVSIEARKPLLDTDAPSAG